MWRDRTGVLEARNGGQTRRDGLEHLSLALLVAMVLFTACSRESQPKRVIVLGIDGLEPSLVEELADKGVLPAFERLRRQGYCGEIRSEEPLLSPVIWTTIATGRAPRDHGVVSFVVPDEKGGSRPVTSRQRRTRAVWNILSEEKRTVGVVGWWATWPAEEVQGVVVSDRVGLHFLADQEAAAVEHLVAPRDREAEMMSLLVPPDTLGEGDLSDFASGDVIGSATIERDPLGEMGHLRWAVATARSYARMGLRLWQEVEPDLLMVYIEAPDTISHLFGHLYGRQDLAGDLARQQQQFGMAVEGAYRLADEIVEGFMKVMDENTVLVVVSDHGFRLGELLEDPGKARDLRKVSHHHHRLDGTLCVGGAGVVPGQSVENASIYDLTPTILALGGVAPSEEMPGRVLLELFEAEPWWRDSQRVASYEGTGEREPGVGEVEEGTASPLGAGVLDEALEAHLQALGYLDDENLTVRNEAVLALRDGLFAEAAEGFRKLLETAPDDASLHAGLGGALAGLGDDSGALDELALALALDPLHLPAFINRGLLWERQGEMEAAMADYRAALQVDPDYQAALSALERLGVRPTTRVASTSEERRAAALLGEARELARRGDFPAALARIDEAQALTPDEAVVFHYRANICYLMGDSSGAREALEKALELEPGNQVLMRNLERLSDLEPDPREEHH